MVANKEAIQQFYCMKGNRKKTKALNKSDNQSPYLKSLGSRIKQLRIRAGYDSYEKFAYDHDISRAQFGRYENGQDLRFSSLVKLTLAFGITLEEFFSEGF